ncbi:hypothetical protein PROFUN_16985, partial [Planoprotostelium fungivorum]
MRKEAAKIAKEAARLTALNSCLPQLLDLMLEGGINGAHLTTGSPTKDLTPTPSFI